MTLMNRIRESIAVDHDAIEKTDFSIGLVSSTISQDDYLRSLCQLYYVHDALEKACDKHDQLAPFFPPAMRRTSTILSDLKYFESSLDLYSRLPETDHLSDKIMQWGNELPLQLVGCIYVLEGSRMGSLYLAKPIAAALGVQPQEGHGIDYHLEGARETPMRLRQWKEMVSSSGINSDVELAIEHCAVEFMHLLLHLYQALPATKNCNKQVA